MSALNEFRESLKSAERLVRIETRYSDPPRRRSINTVQGLRGGAVVMMVAAFEQFLREDFEEQLAPLSINPPPHAFTALPKRMQVASVFGSLERAMKGPLYGSPAGKINRLPEIRNVAELIVGRRIDLKALSDTRGNPDSSCVRELLINVGIDKPFDVMRPGFNVAWGRPEAISFVQDKLDEIVGRRHLVAHTAAALQVARGELPIALRFLGVLGTVIDGTLSAHLATL